MLTKFIDMLKIHMKQNIIRGGLTNKRGGSDLSHGDSKAFIKYSNDIYDTYKNIQKYNPNRRFKILIVFDDIIYA